MTMTNNHPGTNPSKLTRAQRNKLEARLLRWLDGEEAAALGLPPAPPEAEGQSVARVFVLFDRPLAEPELATYAALGLAAETETEALPGLVTRAALASLAQDPRVRSVEPVHVGEPSSPMSR
jgi:hypothetical protein